MNATVLGAGIASWMITVYLRSSATEFGSVMANSVIRPFNEAAKPSEGAAVPTGVGTILLPTSALPSGFEKAWSRSSGVAPVTAVACKRSLGTRIDNGGTDGVATGSWIGARTPRLRGASEARSFPPLESATRDSRPSTWCVFFNSIATKGGALGVAIGYSDFTEAVIM